jgi:hypothetical protein
VQGVWTRRWQSPRRADCEPGIASGPVDEAGLARCLTAHGPTRPLRAFVERRFQLPNMLVGNASRARFWCCDLSRRRESLRLALASLPTCTIPASKLGRQLRRCRVQCADPRTSSRALRRPPIARFASSASGSRAPAWRGRMDQDMAAATADFSFCCQDRRDADDRTLRGGRWISRPAPSGPRKAKPSRVLCAIF